MNGFMKSRYHALATSVLLSRVQSACQEEKRILADLLHYLLEIDERKAYLEWGYGSLFSFLTDGLGYERASAYRRLSATRAMKAMPEIEKKLTDGSLTLSTLCQVQQLIRHEEKSRPVALEEKRDLLALVENKSQSQAERILVEARPVAMQAIRESRAHVERPVPGNKREIKLIVSEDVYAKWERLKDLRSQADFERSPEELMDWLLELALDKADPARRETRREARKEKEKEKQSKSVGFAAELGQTAERNAQPEPGRSAEPPTSHQTNQRSFALLRDLVFKRDGYRCSYVSPITGRRCESTHGLEIDHIQPRAHGGADSPNYLRVYCDAHNRERGAQLSSA